MTQIGAVLGAQSPTRDGGRQPSAKDGSEAFGDLLSAQSSARGRDDRPVIRATSLTMDQMDQEDGLLIRRDAAHEGDAKPKGSILEVLISWNNAGSSDKAETDRLTGTRGETASDGEEEALPRDAAAGTTHVRPEDLLKMPVATQGEPDPSLVRMIAPQDRKSDGSSRNANGAEAPAKAQPSSMTIQPSAERAQPTPVVLGSQQDNASPVDLPEETATRQRDARTASAAFEKGVEGPVGVKVLSDQAIPAPSVGQAGSSTATRLAAAIGEDTELLQILDKTVAVKEAEQKPSSTPVRDLRIQLNPASLGEVTARLRLSGEQLTVEIHADRAEAAKRLSADKDAIVSSLKSLGFQVDDVLIHHQAPSAPSGSENAAMRSNDNAAGHSRGFDRQQGNQAHENGRGGNAPKSGKDTGREDQTSAGRASAGGLYI